MTDEFAGRTIAVTGATGFVGRAVVAEIDRLGGTAIALTRSENAIVPPASEVRAVGSISAETVWDPALDKCEAVIHCAARAHILADRAADPLAEYRKVNRDGTESLAKACARSGVGRLIIVSSVKVNGEDTMFDPVNGSGRPYTAADRVNPTDPYGRSKLEAEEAARRVSTESGLAVTIIRPPLVYGPGVAGNMARLLRLVAGGLPLPLGAIRNRRSLIGVGNLASALVTATGRGRPNGLYLVSDGEDVSTPDLIRAMAVSLSVRPRLMPVPPSLLRVVGVLTGRSAEIDRLIGSLQVDAKPFRKDMGWSPAVSFAEGIQVMADAYRARQA